MSIKISFLGAAGTVTGSKYLVEYGDSRILIDCGLFQGLKKLRLRNWAEPPFDPASIDAILLTHAHLDHSGYLPLVVREGFSKRIFCTAATADLCDVLLRDSGKIQEENAEHANRYRYSKHHPALPLYTVEDAEQALEQFSAIEFGKWFDVTDDIRACYRRVSHILGAATIHLDIAGTRVVFSGDVGRSNDSILMPPEPIERADVLVVESTYGNRLHTKTDPADELGEIVSETASKQGIVVIPSFAVGRAQSVLRLISLLKQAKRIPDIPVYLDSPMAISATDIFCRHKDDHKLSEEDCDLMCENVKYVRTADESKALCSRDGPMIIISASGMATGGRVLHHIKAFAPDPLNTLLFTGYQAIGTRGRTIVDGTDTIKLHGGTVPIRARVEIMDGLGAHADADELVQWLSSPQLKPQRVFVTHGEERAAAAFQKRLVKEFGWDASVPSDGETVEIASADGS